MSCGLWHSVNMELIRYECAGLESLAPLVAAHGGGVYVVEFASGEQYVGQTRNFVRRMAQHLHGSRHHSPWAGEVTAVAVMTTAPNDMDYWERRLIAEKRQAGILLRNSVFNIGGSGRSALDDVILTVDQQHWVSGDMQWDAQKFAVAAGRPPGPTPQLLSDPESNLPIGHSSADAPSRADLIIEALALIVEQAIPNAVELESVYWTVSDLPSTGGGRFATLNVGNLELAFFPRCTVFEPTETLAYCDAMILNTPHGTFTDEPAGINRHTREADEWTLVNPTFQPPRVGAAGPLRVCDHRSAAHPCD